MNYKYKDIDKIYTDIVLEYLQNGYIIYSPSMKGNQGEISKIILSNSNKELICIYMDTNCSCREEDQIKIIVGKYSHNNYNSIYHDTLWLNKLQEIKKLIFYKLDKDHGNYYTDDINFLKQCKEKQRKRLHLRYESKSKPIELKHKQAFVIAYKHCKQTRGYKTVKAKDIISVIKINNKCYRVEINNKDDLIIRF